MKDWRIKNDTLSIQFEMLPGYVAYVLMGRMQKQMKSPVISATLFWICHKPMILLENFIKKFQNINDHSKKSAKSEFFSE